MLKSPQAGFSLVELMVAMVSGLGIVLCASSLYVAQLRLDERLIEQLRFQQGVQMLLDVIERDMRRAGYLAAGAVVGPTTWPGLYWSANCVVVAIDMNSDGIWGGEQELRGYRYHAGRQRLEVKSWLQRPVTPAAACQEAGWQDMTDGQYRITAFELMAIAPSHNILSMRVVAQDPHASTLEVSDERRLLLRNW